MIHRNLPKQDIQSLRVFMAIAECNGITAAQERLKMSQSLISTRLSDLEYRLGFVLCKRGRAGFALTKEGEAVYQSCLRLFDSVDLFSRQMNAIKNPDHAYLNIAMVHDVPDTFIRALPDILSKLYQQNIGLTMNLDVKTAAEIEQAVVSDHLDSGIISTNHFLNELVYEKVFTAEHAVFCHKNHPILKQEATIESLKEVSWVRNYHESSITPVEMGQVSAEVNSEETALSFILSGTHIGYLVVDDVKEWINQGIIQMLLPKEASYQVAYYLLHKKQINKPARAWIGLLKNNVQSVTNDGCGFMEKPL